MVTNPETTTAKENVPSSNVKNFTQNKSLFHFASTKDKLLIATGIFCAICYGARFLVMASVIGVIGNIITTVDMTHSYSIIKSEQNMIAVAPRSALDGFHSYSVFQQNFGLKASLATVIVGAINRMILLMGIFVFLSWIFCLGMAITLDRAALNQVNRIRNAFINSLLRQDIDWFDKCQSSKFISQTENDFFQYQDAIGFKLGTLAAYLSMYFLPFFYGLYLEWKVTLVGYCSTTAFYLLYKFTTMVQNKFSSKQTKAYAKAGIVAEDVFTAIKTVLGSNGQEIEAKRYAQCINKGRKAGIIKVTLLSIGHGLFVAVLFSTYALTCWYSTYLFAGLPKQLTDGDLVFRLLTVIMLISVAGIRISEIFGLANSTAQAYTSGKRCLEIINKVPSYDYDTNSDKKDFIETINDIEFEDVEFSYPSRDGVTVLSQFNLKINKGESVALVGNSGCGKSTVTNLLLRFYDPQKGSIKINGYDIKDLNLKWLRNQIGVVGQEPVLFPTTVYENIRYGFSQASQEDVVFAAKLANAHNFIMDLPQDYQTNVGDRGAMLSGGQKQRIAIARALVRKPSILLLDEATSALDSESERVVQEALDNVMIGRTSIIIAHRLSTIKNADKIVVMTKGQLVECGNHDALLLAEGEYFRFIKAQLHNFINEDDVNFKINHESKDGDNPKTRTISDNRKSISKKALNGDALTPTFINPSTNEEIESANKKKFKTNIIKSSMSVRNWFLIRLLRVGGWASVLFILGMIASVIQGIAFMQVMATVLPLINYIFEDHGAHLKSGLFLFLNTLLIKGGTFLVADVAMATLSGLSGNFISQRLREKLFYSMLRQEAGWYEEKTSSVGNLCLMLSFDIENVKATLSTHISTIVTIIAQTTVGLIIMFQLSWEYGSVTAACFITSILLSIYTKYNLQKRIAKEAHIMRSSNEILRDIVVNIKTIRFLSAEEEFCKLYERKTVTKFSKNYKSRYITSGLGAIIDSFSQLGIVFVGLLSPSLFLYDKVVLFSFFKACNIAGMANSFNRSVSAVPNVVSAMNSLEKIYAIIDRQPLIDNFSTDGVSLENDATGKIAFSKVTFSYPTRPNFLSLNDFEMKVNDNEIVAIVGSSGSGKSTCVQLAPRFYDPQRGSVSVCDVQVQNMNVYSLRQKMSIVQQEPLVFNRTIFENIAYGDLTRDVTFEEIIEVAKIAQIHDTIVQLPQGYDTLVGTRGTQISGGQKQRIAIARALVKKPKLLFLDEATSALDSETDKELQLSLRNNKSNATIVIIAHRLSTITDVDYIFVVNQGQVVEKGNHKELLQQKGLYHTLYTNQLSV